MKIKTLLKNIIIDFKFIRIKISLKNVDFNLFIRIKVSSEFFFLKIKISLKNDILLTLLLILKNLYISYMQSCKFLFNLLMMFFLINN